MRSFIRLALPGALFLVSTWGASAGTVALDGKQLAFERSKGNCLSCHEIKGGNLPGTIGPPLSDIKSRYDRKELIAIITDETQRNPQTMMPPFGRNLILTDKEIAAIADYLLTL